MTVLERLSTALVSDDLTLKEKRGDLDYVIALGMVGAKHRTGSALIQVSLGGNSTSYQDLLKATRAIVVRLSAKNGWNLNTSDLRRISEAAIKLYLMPICPKCEGRKFLTIDGAPILSAKPCPKCHGSGRRRVPIQDGRKIAEVVYAMERIEDITGEAIRKKMRSV